MTYRNSSATSPTKRVVPRRDATPNDPYTARKAAREAAKAMGERNNSVDETTPSNAVVSIEAPIRDAVSNR